jgi:small subunit ribosomal protein S9
MEKTTTFTGKRKTAVAKAMLKEGTGKILINKVSHLHLNHVRKMMIEEPIRIAKEHGIRDFDISITIHGGGIESQIEASRLAIARAIIGTTKSETLKKIFQSYDKNLLIADIRRKEARKPNDSKARAKRQKSYR